MNSAPAAHLQPAPAPLPVMPFPVARPTPRLVWLPLILIGVLASCLLLPRVQQNERLFAAFAGTAGLLFVWQTALALWYRRRGRRLAVESVTPVRQHYIQACVQLCLYVYWGWWWVQPDGTRPIYAQTPLILAQFAFLYAFDALFAWTRGRVWRLTSGPTPIVLSTNLFIWFRDDWFLGQFAMIVAALLGKEFVKWHKEGRRTHVFNPSGFGLAVAAIALIATGNVDLTWAKELATTIENPPGIFLFIFGLGLVVQHFFAVTLMTFAAAVVMVLINYAYSQATGVYLFGSTNLPAAAFLGLMLLMTDPSTSPRTYLGRALFGAGYGLGYVIVFQVLGAIGAPELFAKLFPVPILNVCVQRLDRLARTGWTGRLNTNWQSVLPWRAINAVHMGLWSLVFFGLWRGGYIGHEFGGVHPGNSISFWKQAVVDGKPEAQRKLVMVAGSNAIAAQDLKLRAAALNELGVLSISGAGTGSRESELESAAGRWAHAMALGSLEACENIVILDLFHVARASDREPALAFQRLRAAEAAGARGRACYLVGAGFEKGGKPAVALQLYQRCGDDAWAAKGIARLALAHPGLPAALERAVPRLEAAAAAGDGESCWYLAHLHTNGRGVARDAERAARWRDRAVQLGYAPALASRDAAELPPFTAPDFDEQVPPPWSTAFPAGSGSVAEQPDGPQTERAVTRER